MSLGDLFSGSGNTLNQIAALQKPIAPAPGPPAGPPAGGGSQSMAPPPQGAPQPSTAPASPPDLAQLYIRLQQQDRAANMFDKGLAGFQAAFAPPGQQSAWLNSAPPAQDAGSQIQNLMQIQQMQLQRQNMQSMLSPEFISEMATRTGLSPAEVRVEVMNGKIGDIISSQAGIGGPPGMQDMIRGRQVYMAQHGITDPGDSSIPNYYKFPDQYQTHQAVEGDKAKDVASTQNNFQPAVQGYDLQLSNINQLLDPNNKKYLDEFIGPVQSKLKPIGEMSPQAQALKATYDTTMAAQFGSAVQDFPGSRISTKELQADAPSKSSMSLSQGTDSFLKAADQYRDQIQNHRANLFGKAQQLGSPSLSDAEADKYVDPIYKSGGSLGSDAPDPRPAPAQVQSPNDVVNLPAGRKFVLPDKTTGYAVHNPSDIAKLPHGAKFIVPSGPNAGQIGTAP